MRPNPLMATLSCFAWVICFEPLEPCIVTQRASAKPEGEGGVKCSIPQN